MSLLDTATWQGKIFSNGWTSPEGGEAAVIAPATGEEIGRTGSASPADIARGQPRGGARVVSASSRRCAR